VRKEAMENYKANEKDAKEERESIFGDEDRTFMDIAHQEALDEEWRQLLEKINKQIADEGEKTNEELAEMVREKKDKETLCKVAKRLGTLPSYAAEDISVIAEGIIKKLLSSHETSDDRSSKQLLNEIIGVTMAADKNKDFSGWSHSICHLFEMYKRGEASLLDAPDEVVAKLVDDAVARSIQSRQEGNMSRIVGPLLQYNLDHINPDRLDGSFSFKPDSLNNEEFISLFSNADYAKSLRLFCAARTPREFLKQLIKENIKSLPSGLEPEKVITLLRSMQDNVSREEMNAYVNKFYRINNQDTTLETLTGNLSESENALERIDGVYVDVEGTLISGGELNSSLVNYLEEQRELGRKVVIFSGGNPEELTKNLSALGLSEKFLPVISKLDFKGKVLEELIDDTVPEYQGFKAAQYKRPPFSFLIKQTYLG